jgi:hypothetical protein
MPACIAQQQGVLDCKAMLQKYSFYRMLRFILDIFNTPEYTDNSLLEIFRGTAFFLSLNYSADPTKNSCHVSATQTFFT